MFAVAGLVSRPLLDEHAAGLAFEQCCQGLRRRRRNRAWHVVLLLPVVTPADVTLMDNTPMSAGSLELWNRKMKKNEVVKN